MRTADTHISDQDLLRAADGELPGREAARIQFHLVGCWTCRARRAELERTIEDFVTAHQRESDGRIPEADGPRALLRARLRELEETDRPSLAEQCRRVFLRLRGPVFAGLAAGAAVIIGLSVFSSVQSVRASSKPDSALTPGATRTSERDDVCSPSPREGFYPIPATLAYRVFEKYRIRNPKPGAYEVDYLITPALGGADDIENLWPQPYASGEWNAHVKDALEDHLHQMVCRGQVELRTAQREIAGDWIAAYRKYFQTNHPLEIHTDFSLDAPWQD